MVAPLSRRHFLTSSAAVAALAFLPRVSEATALKTPQQAINRCLEILRGCQMTDGAFRVSATRDQVWIQVYFAQHAALAMLYNPDSVARRADLARIRRWLDWCVDYQESDGFWYDYVGTLGNYASNGYVDAWDSVVSLTMLVIERYQALGGLLSASHHQMADLCLGALADVTDPRDGLTWAKPDYKIKYLMDNIETYAALIASSRYVARRGRRAQSNQLLAQSRQVATGLRKFYDAEIERFDWALDEAGNYSGGFRDSYPHGMAQLFGVTYVQRERGPWTATLAQFPPEDTAITGMGPERFLMGATALRLPIAATLRRETIASVSNFAPGVVYLHRPALAALALSVGPNWLAALPLS